MDRNGVFWRGGRDSNEAPDQSSRKVGMAQSALGKTIGAECTDLMTLDELRAAQREAIRARAWRSVEILQEQIDAIERAGVIDLATRRTKT